jgi:hypothetical protein
MAGSEASPYDRLVKGLENLQELRVRLELIGDLLGSLGGPRERIRTVEPETARGEHQEPRPSSRPADSVDVCQTEHVTPVDRRGARVSGHPSRTTMKHVLVAPVRVCFGRL